MKFLPLMASLAVLLLAAPDLPAQDGPDREEWMQLFNGRNLDGWAPKITGYPLNQNYGNTFRVEDGYLTVSYDRYNEFERRFGHIFYTTPFSYYIIAVEYRFIGEQAPGGPDWARRNSGIMVHSQEPSSMLLNQDFPVSIEVQLLGGLDEGERPTANLCTPGTHVVMQGKLVTRHCTQADAPTIGGDEWVRVEATVLGSSVIRHRVNGDTALEYEMPQIGGGNVNPVNPRVKEDGKLLESGYISLQSESHPVQFRKVELLDLEGCMDPKASNYKTYHVKSNPGRCRYGE